MRNAQNIKDVIELGIDFIGFIFWKKSPRNVMMRNSKAGIIPDGALFQTDEIKRKKIKTVGVFVDEMPQNIFTYIYNYKLDYVQLHGNESRVMIENLRSSIADMPQTVKVIKAISIKNEDDVFRWREYDGVVDLFLFDTKCDSVGGSGKKFDWNIINKYDGSIPFLLSGGIGTEDVKGIKQFKHPMFVGIDLNSKFETEPGLKDVNKLKDFIYNLRK